MKRRDWELPNEIDMADIDSIDALVSIGQKAADAIDWNSILG
jgi:hypothetical protein